MKTFSTSIYSLLFVLSYTLTFGQWKTNTVGGNSGDAYYVNGKIKVTSSGGSVGGDNNYQGIVVNHNNFYTAAATINSAFSTVPTANLFKAQAGVPVNITLEILHKFVQEGGNLPPTTHQVFINYFTDDNWGAGDDWYGGTIKSSIGKNEQAYLYDQNINLTKNSQYVHTYEEPAFNGLGRKSTFTGTYTFPVGRTRGWIVIGFREKSYTNYNVSSHNNFVILPFVVEGPMETQVDSLGVTTEPQVPYMVVHNPPGDGSSTTVTNTGTKCRSFEETFSKDQSNTISGSIKLGYKGSVGFISTIDIEAYVEFSGSGTQGSFTTKNSSNQSCMTVGTSLTASSGGGKGAQNNDLFVGYGIDLAYGVGRAVKIIDGNSTKVDTSLIYRPLPETKKIFFKSKSAILADIIHQQSIIDDENRPIKDRASAQYQINVWSQVLANNDANIAAASSQTGENQEFSGNDSPLTFNSTIDYSTSQSIQVEHYISSEVGIQGVVNIGGSGFSLGAKFASNKNFGNIQSSSGGQSQNISITLDDNDPLDNFDLKVVKDPVYGTPIFIIKPALTRSSCPYEEGYAIDQPRLEIVGQTGDTINLNNTTIGTPGTFQVKFCNDSNYDRTYRFGFVSQSNLGDLSLSAAGNVGNQTSPFFVEKNSCTIQNYDVNIARKFSTSPTEFTALKFVLTDNCNNNIGDISSAIFANLDFAIPSPPTNVSVSPNELCTQEPITLTANCQPTYTPTWYSLPTGGAVLALGTSVTLNPTSNITYYVGCQNTDYNRARVATKPILFATPMNSLNLSSDFSANSLQIANTTLTASNKIIDPARVKYKAANSLTFNPGFEAKAGSTFEAEIGGCVD
ncbi:immunoglobulin domain-containing protein [Arcticibacterium luteifluviistationis]|nr:3-coathanger stack domain-containing protein [Arcticibacterium luteifluviistationis]